MMRDRCHVRGSGIAAALILMLICSSAVAETSVTGLTLVFQTGVTLLATMNGANVYSAQSGGAAKFVVLAAYSDGTTQDVTDDAALEHQLVSIAASLAGPGSLAFDVVEHSTSAGLQTSYQGQTIFTSLIVQP